MRQNNQPNAKRNLSIITTIAQGLDEYITNVIEYEYDYFEIIRVRLRLFLKVIMITIVITCNSSHHFVLFPCSSMQCVNGLSIGYCPVGGQGCRLTFQ